MTETTTGTPDEGSEPIDEDARSRRDPLRELEAKLDAAVDELRPKVRRALDEMEARVDAAMKEVQPKVSEAMKDVRPKWDRFLTDVQPRMDRLLQRIQAKIDDLRREMEARAQRAEDRSASGDEGPRPPAGELPPWTPDEPDESVGGGAGAP